MKLRKSSWVVIGLMILCGLTFGLNLIFETDYTKGSSMAPTLKNEQLIVVMRPQAMARLHVSYQRQDIAIVSVNPASLGLGQKELLVKRIIGLPKEQVGVGNSQIYINGRKLAEPYVHQGMDNSRYAYGGIPRGGDIFNNRQYVDNFRLGAKDYYILGDNRPKSADSRYFGAVTRSQLQGKIVWRLPLNYNQEGQRILGNLLIWLPGYLLVIAVLILIFRNTPYSKEQ